MLNEMGKNAKKAAALMLCAGELEKNNALLRMAQALLDQADDILEANKMDLAAARQTGMSEAMQDRLTLTPQRISQMAEGITQIAALPDPVGSGIGSFTRPNGLRIHQVRVPIGVIAIIYESRPNVTADAAALCFKTSNACILRGGKEAINSNRAITEVLRNAIAEVGLPADAVNLVTDVSRETALGLMKLNEYVDLLIPRGGAGLIKTVTQNSTVPVIETGTGNCHIYADAYADIEMAINITQNAKCSRPSVCNAAETLLVNKAIAQRLLPPLCDRLRQQGVTLKGCSRSQDICPMDPADESDYANEFLSLTLAVKIVDDIDDALEHIRRYSSGHSEAIITNDYGRANMFVRAVDSAAVYVNASTRFTDGGEFGFGAEIGISTQKIHARGPMGLKELTTYKYIIYGDGQTR